MNAMVFKLVLKEVEVWLAVWEQEERHGSRLSQFKEYFSCATFNWIVLSRGEKARKADWDQIKNLKCQASCL